MRGITSSWTRGARRSAVRTRAGTTSRRIKRRRPTKRLRENAAKSLLGIEFNDRTQNYNPLIWNQPASGPNVDPLGWVGECHVEVIP